MTKEYYILTDYPSYRDGTNNLQRTRIVPIGAVYAFIKEFYSRKEQSIKRARAWAKKNNLKLVK